MFNVCVSVRVFVLVSVCDCFVSTERFDLALHPSSELT